jgi:RHS repeat-associated protein
MGGIVALQYDGDGNRVAKTVGATTTRYLVDDLNPTGYPQVAEELTNGAASRTYTYGLQRISQYQPISGTASFYQYDGGGNVRQLTNIAGAVTDQYEYDAFGNEFTVSGGSSTPNNYLYRGEQYDTDLGLYYLRARYYNPLTGRFMSRDPEDGDVTDPATLHKYVYANGDPVNLSDPSGRATATLAPPQTGKIAGSEYLGMVVISLSAAAAVDAVGQALNCAYTLEGSVMEAAAESIGYTGFQTWRDSHCSVKLKKTCREKNPTWPVFYVSFATTPAIARNDWYAINVDGKRDDLHYDADLQRRAQRRDLACPTGKYYGTRGEQCDEYPFASTWEGGAGATTALVPRSENSAQGGYLKGLYSRLSDGQGFCVEVGP